MYPYDKKNNKMNAPYDKHHNTICPFPPFLLSLLNKIKSVYRNRLSAVNSTFVNKTRCYQSPLQAGLKSRYLQFSLNIKIMPSVLTLWLRAVFFPMMNRSVQPCVKNIYIFVNRIGITVGVIYTFVAARHHQSCIGEVGLQRSCIETLPEVYFHRSFIESRC